MQYNIALLSAHNSYIGREYARALIKNGINFFYLTFGNNNDIDIDEDKRCGGYWKPPIEQDIFPYCQYKNFSSLNDVKFKEFVITHNINLAIQGDIGEIIKQDIIECFKYGILNFHPGDLPKYRGCSAPEWQIYNGDKIICTCHYIDKGIDTGDIIKKKILDIPENNYYKIRASIYPQISEFICEIIYNFVNKKITYCKQNENEAIYRKYIGDDIIQLLVDNEIKLGSIIDGLYE